MARIRGTLAITGGVAVAALLAACGSSSTAPSAPSPQVGPPPSTAVAPATPNTAMTPNASLPGPCTPDDLTVSLGPQYGAMGHLTQRIVFTNNSDETCTLAGYPGVSLGGGAPPTQIGLSATKTQRDPSTGTVTPQPIQLAPNGAAHAIVQLTRAENFDPATCDPVLATVLIVYPPDGLTAVRLPFRAVACANPVRLLEVTFVTVGS